MARNSASVRNVIHLGTKRSHSRIRYTKCGKCNGTGTVSTGLFGMTYENCDVCGGTGKARLR